MVPNIMQRRKFLVHFKNSIPSRDTLPSCPYHTIDLFIFCKISKINYLDFFSFFSFLFSFKDFSGFFFTSFFAFLSFPMISPPNYILIHLINYFFKAILNNITCINIENITVLIHQNTTFPSPFALIK